MSTQPTPESAQFLRDFLVSRIRDEHQTTNKVFAALTDADWRPDPRSRSARQLAWHIASSERWFLDGLAKRKFVDTSEAPPPETIPEIIAFYNNGIEPAFAAVSAITGEQLNQIIDFFGMEMPLYALFNFCHVHVIHHRAQLATYIRPLGGKVPDIYGGSADTPYQP